MSELCGAWSLSGSPIGDAPSPETGRSWHHCEGPLRLDAAPGRLAAAGGRVAACEGWLAGDLAGLTARGTLAGLRPLPEGHYVLIEAEPAKGRLTLLRDPTGGERLFFALKGRTLFFAASLKRLISLSGLPRRVDSAVIRERALVELSLGGDETLLDGIREVLPGHALVVEDGRLRPQKWLWDGLLQGLEGDSRSLARLFHERLLGAVRLAVSGEGRAAVLLSGGIDSAAVAAMACEALGPERVHAFTYEFDHPAHPSEALLASLVCRHLGIRRHHVLRLKRRECLEAVPESVWRSEDFTCWAKPHVPVVTRRIAEHGFERYLTGFGVGSHMSYLEDLAQVLRWLPKPDVTLRHWKTARFGGPSWGRALGRLHPGLAAPDLSLRSPLYHLLVAALRGRGLLADAAPFYPASLAGLAREAARSERLAGTLAGLEGLPLASQLQRLSFTGLNSCVDIHRLQKLTREAGSTWVSPAHLPSCLPLAFFPPRPKPPFWHASRGLRPGKGLLALAMGDRLPAVIVRKRKLWREALLPEQWLVEALAEMERASGPSLEALAPCLDGALEPLRRLSPTTIVPLAFWHRLFIGRPLDAPPPTWSELAG